MINEDNLVLQQSLTQYETVGSRTKDGPHAQHVEEEMNNEPLQP